MQQNNRSGGHNGPPPQVPGGVPLVGQSVYVRCPQGHVERLAAPLCLMLPGNLGEGPTVIVLCRVCVSNVVRVFGAGILDDDEIEQLRAAGELPGAASAAGGA